MAAAPVAPPAVAPGTHVSVHLLHVGALPATVEAAEPGALRVALAVADARVRRLAGTEVAVEVTTGRGIQRFSGVLELDAARAELLRIVLSGDAERIQRREWARVEAVVPVHLHGLEEPVDGDTTTLNVSGGGILVNDPWNMPLGIDVRMELQVEPGGQPIRALGRVVREMGKDRKGVRILDISRDDESRLVRFVRERELAALRLARGR
jgi:c-di-GMP-binding flagellar brake protein YcgR